MREYEFIFWFTNGHFTRITTMLKKGIDVIQYISDILFTKPCVNFIDVDSHTIINMNNVTKVEVRPVEDNDHA